MQDYNKTFLVQTKAGKKQFVIERQMPHDPQYRVGSRIPGRGVVVEVNPAVSSQILGK